jgi:hypothetical protein
MILKLKREAGIPAFFNKDILFIDFKTIKLDRVLTNLFIKMYADGYSISSAFKKEFTMNSLKKILAELENQKVVIGASDNPEGVEDWLRSSLLDFANRGNVIKERISSLKPLHLLSFKILNSKYCRDYRTSDQLYLMLKHNPEIMEGLSNFLSKGFDKGSGNFVIGEELDVDTTGILRLTSPLRITKNLNREIIETPKPFLVKQTELFNDDIKRLLLYKNIIPRIVFIDYLRILCGFHLAIYTMKVVYLLPKMVEAGTRDINDDWSMVVDLTDNLDSHVSYYACKDFERIENSLNRYIRSTFMLHAVQQYKKCDIDEALRVLKEDNNISDAYYRVKLEVIENTLPEKDEKEFDKYDFAEMLSLFPEEDYFNKLIHVYEKSVIANRIYKYFPEFVDSVSMKNSPSMLIADSRSRKHPRRGVLGSKLLETLVQLLVLRQKEDGSYETHSLSIEDLASEISSRYGLIINGVHEERFADANVEMNAAFKVNMDAFKNKLRQIGFYTDMSDACILQKIRPRYKLDE